MTDTADTIPNHPEPPTCRGRGPLRAALLVLVASGLLWLGSCEQPTVDDRVAVDLPEIRARDTLRAITTYSGTSYFVYRGQPMGFEFELLQRLADQLGVNLQIVVAENIDNLFEMLHEGKGDLIAHNLTITKHRTREVAFTEPFMTTRQVLVQRKPDGWRKMKLHEINAALIRNPVNLIGKKIYVRRNSSYYARLVNLSEEIGGDIEIIAADGDESTEQLIRKVAEGKIDFTVADENIAFISKTYYPDLDVKTPISLPQRIAWALRKSSPELLDAVNTWLEQMKQTPDYYTIYNKYFKNRKAYRRRVRSQYYTLTGDKISPYDSLIRIHAQELGWDWRLLAAMIFQESQFDTLAESWAGAQGLMQMMPAIAEQFGVTDLWNPHQSLDAGSEYLAYLQGQYVDVPDTLERIKFVLASYNVGENHVRDARRLAEKDGIDPDVWSDAVDRFMLKLSDPEFYKDDVVKWGYARGEEAVEYVNEVLDRYDHYRRLVRYSAR